MKKLKRTIYIVKCRKEWPLVHKGTIPVNPVGRLIRAARG